MATGKQVKTKRLNMAERAQHQMDVLFPGFPNEWLWHRKKNDGYSTIPRTLPIAMQAIDMQSKGQPAGHTLFCLWARSPDHALVTIENPAIFASEVGFLGERAVDTWRRRMKKLKELEFIVTREGASGEFHYVLLLNPNVGIEHIWRKGLVQDVVYTRFIERALEIGAFGDIDQIREFWAKEEAAKAAQESQEKDGENSPST